MSHFFGLHSGHLTDEADRIAEGFGAEHVNYVEPGGEKRGWFSCQNLGEPFDSTTAASVLDAVSAEGGCNAEPGS